MPTFYRTALDVLTRDLGRTLRPLPISLALSRPPITVVQARSGFDRDTFIRQAVDNAAVLHGITTSNLCLNTDADPLLLASVVRRMVSDPAFPAPSVDTPRILIVRDLLALAPTERREALRILNTLSESEKPCHVITTVEKEPDMALEWSGRTGIVRLDLSLGAELAMIIAARGAVTPGHSPLIRDMMFRRWQTAGKNKALDATFAQAVAEFTVDHVVRQTWPCPAQIDDPLLLFGHALAPLPASCMFAAVNHLVDGLANHPLMAPYSESPTKGEFDLNAEARAVLSAAFQRSENRWTTTQRDQAMLALQRPRPIERPDLSTTDTVAFDTHADVDAIDVLDLDERPSVPLPPALPMGLWQRMVAWLGFGSSLPIPSSAHPLASGAPPKMSRAETVAWNALDPLFNTSLHDRWLPASTSLIRVVMRWPVPEMREAMAFFFDGLSMMPVVPPAVDAGVDGNDGVEAWLTTDANPRWSLRDRHALLLACESIPGWTPSHQQTLGEALEPVQSMVYDAPSGGTTGSVSDPVSPAVPPQTNAFSASRSSVSAYLR